MVDGRKSILGLLEKGHEGLILLFRELQVIMIRTFNQGRRL